MADSSTGKGLTLGDIEVPAAARVRINEQHFDDTSVSVIEYLPREGDPKVKIEVYGDWGEATTYMSPDKARWLQDRLGEVIEIAEDHK